MESTEDYLKRLESYMKFYAALVQTEIPNVGNLHGLQEGWAWLARLLNAFPANQYTAVSLNAFLQMAGFALFKRYQSQFVKLLKVVYENFLADLKAQNIPDIRRTLVDIHTYIEDEKFLQEPGGRSLHSHLLSTYVHEICELRQHPSSARVVRGTLAFLGKKLWVLVDFREFSGPHTNKEEVYEVATKPVVKAAMEGIKGTVFAYGVTSSGLVWAETGLTEWAETGFLDWAKTGLTEWAETGFLDWAKTGLTEWAETGFLDWAETGLLVIGFPHLVFPL
ncbi:hypothetical protein RIF29_38580 [Crotalaria pallida]|uniref:mRNA export factor GLE1 n=1 Tax=Crotalaria pallida TaxID=3830 RepID=A0AAN9DZH9_CROPI